MNPDGPPAGSWAARLANDLDDELAALGLPGSVQRAPWGMEYGESVVAVTVPPPEVARHWAGRPVIAASAAVQAALAEGGVGATLQRDTPLVPLPEPTLRVGAPTSLVVRCDDQGPPRGDAVAVGAFLLCWALDAPGARLSLADPGAAAIATSLGCRAEGVGAPPVVVLCSGCATCPPPLVVDALGAGIPVVGWRTPALADVVGAAGVLVERGEGIEGLAAALSQLLGDPQVAADVGRRGPLRLGELQPGAGLRALARDLARGSEIASPR